MDADPKGELVHTEGFWATFWTYMMGGTNNNNITKTNNDQGNSNKKLASKRFNKSISSTKLPGGEKSWFNGLILCLWDNIQGPRVEQVFKFDLFIDD